MLGKEVARLIDREMKSGSHQRAVLDGSKLSSGIYVSRLRFKGRELTNKLTLLK
jgi:hypothetical protein